MSASGTPPGAAGTSGRDNSQQEIDVKKLNQDKIKQLMGSDPRFITRLISQLDKNMHNMMVQKQKKQEQITADTKEIQQIDHVIHSHVMPNLDRLTEEIKRKTELRDNLRRQLGEQTKNLKDMQSDAASLIQKARTMNKKLMRATASQMLEEARGFNTTTPTTTILKNAAATGTKKL